MKTKKILAIMLFLGVVLLSTTTSFAETKKMYVYVFTDVMKDIQADKDQITKSCLETEITAVQLASIGVEVIYEFGYDGEYFSKTGANKLFLKISEDGSLQNILILADNQGKCKKMGDVVGLSYAGCRQKDGVINCLKSLLIEGDKPLLLQAYLGG